MIHIYCLARWWALIPPDEWRSEMHISLSAFSLRSGISSEIILSALLSRHQEYLILTIPFRPCSHRPPSPTTPPVLFIKHAIRPHCPLHPFPRNNADHVHRLEAPCSSLPRSQHRRRCGSASCECILPVVIHYLSQHYNSTFPLSFLWIVYDRATPSPAPAAPSQPALQVCAKSVSPMLREITSSSLNSVPLTPPTPMLLLARPPPNRLH